jgi:hypothetical protein
MLTPVMFPPGRDMLGIRPKPTGSLVIATIGMVDVTSLRGTTVRSVNAKIRLGLLFATSRASLG